MPKETIYISSKPIEISEHENYKEATFLISVLDEYNLNDVLIEQSEGEKYHSTILGYPIVAYLIYDQKGNPSDFGGHELRKKYNAKTKQIEYYFATFPIGSVTESWIEEREVEGYDGKKKCILIKTKLWSSRYPSYFEVFDKLWDDGKLSSSWEISVNESEKTDKGKKLIDFEFIGNCVLGSNVKGAVNGAGVLEVASEEEISYSELSNALAQDIENHSGLENDFEKTNITSSETNVNEEDNKINNKQGGIDTMSETAKNLINETSAMTGNDLHSKVRKAINAANTDKWYYIARLYPYEYRAIAYDWNQETEDDFVEFVYTVNSDETVSITSQKDVKMVFAPKETIEAQLAEKDTKIAEVEKLVSEKDTEITTKVEEIVKLGQELASKEEIIKAKDEEIASYIPFKEKADAEEKARLEAELSEKKSALKVLATKGNYITIEEIENSEELKKFIDELDEKSIKAEIASRIIAKLDEDKHEPEVETSSVNQDNSIIANLNNGDEGVLTATELLKKTILKKRK